MILRRSIYTIGLLVLFNTLAFGQIIDVGEEEEEQERRGSSILDDTTKQVYGPTTSSYTYEYNVKYNNPHYYNIDTSITDYHKYQYLAQQEYLYQNLGNVATPAKSIFPLIRQQIGATSGFHVYDLYFVGPENIKYYDTKSPFSRFKIIWGGQGRAITEVTYTRNIDERSNFGFDYRGLFIDKQIERQGRGDRNVRGTYYTLYGNYATKDGKYRLLANFERNRHKVDEYGGVSTGENPVIEDYFSDNLQASLSSANTDELRTNYHLYHQYALNDLIQAYHSFDRYKQQNDYIDDLTASSGYFDFIELDSSDISSSDVKDRSKITYTSNEAGIKGDVGKTFYNFYYKHREVEYFYKYLDTDTIANVESDFGENYTGVNLRFGNDSVSYINAFGEYMLEGGNFKLGGSIQNNWIKASAITQQYEPSFIQKAYRGSHDVWVNDFDPSLMTKIEATLFLKVGGLTVSPSVSNTLLGSYIYFEKRYDVADTVQSVFPKQASSDINILSPALTVNFNFWNGFNFNSKIIYSNVAGGSADAVNIPDIYARGQLSLSGIDFEGNLEWQVGFEAYWKSAYFADRYDPAIMQYYVQEDFEVPSFPLVNFFANAKVNRARLFVKVNNLYQLASQTGYFATPEYPGQATILDFGIDWSFYD